MKKRFPCVLWALPICFGLLGGVVAGCISSMKYQGSWWELVVVGFMINLFLTLAWILLIFI